MVSRDLGNNEGSYEGVLKMQFFLGYQSGDLRVK